MIGALVCAYLASPLSGRSGDDYRVAGVLLVIGIVLWVITWATNKYVLHQETTLDPTKLREYQSRYRGSFLHGGVTPEEVILPVALLAPRR